jgi:hypothetical protein
LGRFVDGTDHSWALYGIFVLSFIDEIWLHLNGDVEIQEKETLPEFRKSKSVI